MRAGGALHPLPARTMLGIPGDLAAARESGVLTEHALSRIADEPSPPPLQPVTADLVGRRRWCASRLGNEVADRLVEPLLGGVYAGRADALSVQATMPALYAALADGGSLVEAAAHGRRRGPSGRRRRCSRRCPAASAGCRSRSRRPAGSRCAPGVTVRSIRRNGAGFVLSCGAVPEPRTT